MRARADVVVRLHEHEGDRRHGDGQADEEQPSPQDREDEQGEQEREQSSARVRPEQRGEEQRCERPAPAPPAQRHEEQRNDEQVRGRERREERRGQPPEDDAAALVVDEVLGQAAQPLVRQAELIPEPPLRVAPPRERHEKDVDQPDRRDARGRGQEHAADAPALLRRQVEAAAEEVRLDGQQVVARRVEHALVRRAAAEPGLRQHGVDDDERAEGEREPVDDVRPVERQAARRQTTSPSATSSRTSFHPAIADSAPPRTPARQSCDMTRLCTASPTIRT